MREIEKITTKFIESGAYAALPTDAEKFQTEKELEEAKREELQGAENKQQEVGDVGEAEVSESVISGQSSVKTVTNDELSEAVEKLVGKKDIEKFQIGDNKRNQTEIELSDEFRKIKNAKAKKAYIKATTDFNPKVVE